MQDSPDPRAVFSALGLPAPDEAACEAWRSTQSDLPGKVEFLAPEYVRESCRTLRMKSDVAEALVAALADYDGRPDLQRLAWHWHKQLAALGPSDDPALRSKWVRFHPSPRAEGRELPLFFAHVLLSRLPAIREFHRRRGVPDDISLDTLSDLELWLNGHHRLFGCFGVHRPDWLQNHFTGRLFKLGRLQFETHAFGHGFRAYRHRETQGVTLLAPGGARIRADGQFESADGGAQPGVFTTEFEESAEKVRGNPVSPLGAVLPETVVLASAEWTLIFQDGDPCLGIHIAATGPMDHAQCGESLRRAIPFYTNLFPERPFKAFTCSSWLLDPQFEQYMPADSNIVRFLSEFYLYPLQHANDHQTYERVFDDMKIDIAKAPQKTSLQRIIVNHVKSGNRWRGGGSILFTEDLDWGNKVYRRAGG
jgi:hypothetical protein